MSEDQDKKFDATPHQREEFRKQGRYARARDLAPGAAMAAVTGALLGSRSASSHAIGLLFARSHGDLGAIGRGDGMGVVTVTVGAVVTMAVPVLLAASVAAVVANLAQTGGRVSTENMGFDPSRLDPLPRLKQLFSFRHAMIETGMALLRVCVVAYVSWRTLSIDLPRLLALGRVPVDAGFDVVAAATLHVVLAALGTLLIIAAIDYGQSWYVLEQDMKMSRKELLDETRSQEGDPKAKHKARARARAAIRRRSLANVKKADVIVTNPTHVAVALRYGSGDPAPVVVAKGHDDLALQIRAIARKHGIPILENRPLARALDAVVPVGKPIPAKHFAAVARVLAFVYRLRHRDGIRPKPTGTAPKAPAHVVREEEP